MRFVDRVVFVGTHGAFAQIQHIAMLVMQGHGMAARRFESGANLLTDGGEIDQRTIRRA